MKKILLIISLFLIGLSTVKAYETFYYDEKIPNMYVTKVKGDRERNGATFLLHKSDTSLVYCLDPFTREIDGNYQEYIGYSDIFGLSKEQINNINLISYYGFGYPGHEDIKWYGVTQYLIWQSLGLDDIYFTDSYYGNRVLLYQEEIGEINTLLINHYVLPNFEISNNAFSIENEYVLVDNNDVLKYYDIEYDNGLNVEKKENRLIVSSNKEGTYNIKFIKKSKLLNDYIMYYHDTSQNMFYPGRYDDVTTSINLNFYSGQINIRKIDRETTTKQGEATFEGAIYGLYNIDDDSLIREVSLNEDGIATLSNLPLRKYYIKEIKPSIGYLIDDTKYYVELNTVDREKSVDVLENVIKNRFKIIKLYGNNITDNYKVESNVNFELYDRNNNYINTFITNDKGEIDIELPYGDYILKQTNGMDNFSISKPIELSVKEKSSLNEIIIKDIEEVKYGNLKIKKVGDDGKLLDGVKFKLFAREDIVSLSGDIYYHKGDLICDISTDNGYASIENLYYGKYYLVEIDTVSGYLLNNHPIDVDIKDNEININVINEHYDIPDTGKNDFNYLDLVSKILLFSGILLFGYGFKKVYINS